MMPALHRFGLHLRPIRMADAPAWLAYLSRPGAVEHTRWVLSGLDVLYAQIAASNPFDRDAPALFAIVDDLDQLLGTVGFHTVAQTPRSGEIAYDLDLDHRGRGIASDACAAVAQWGLDERDYAHVDAYALDSNRASLRVLEKCGFDRIELQRGLRVVQGQARDFWLYRRLRET